MRAPEPEIGLDRLALALALANRRLDPWYERAPGHWTFRVLAPDGFEISDYHYRIDLGAYR